MRALHHGNRLFGLQIILGSLLAVAVVVIQLTPLNEIRARVHSQYVTTGLLDYGEKGKILKSLGLVYGVRDESSGFTPYVPDAGRASLFRNKRRKTDYAYRANPGSSFQLPSTLAVGAVEFRKSWTLASLVIDRAALSDPVTGIAANPFPRGRVWERRATVSLFRQDELVLATNTGVRIHGGNRDRALARGGLDQDYRLYLRNHYGVDSVPAELVFGGGDTDVKRLVLRKDRLFVNEFALDIARQIGALVPHHNPVILYVNGENLGIYTLLEHVGRRQWALRLGHDDFYFIRQNGTTDDVSLIQYHELWEWFTDNRERIGPEQASERIDLRNLTRNLFMLMFCGSNDHFKEGAVLDRSENHPRWRWITWETAGCFSDRWVTQGGEPWHQAAVRQVASRDRKNQAWTATYRSLRTDLFAQLLNNSPDYVEYFLRTVTDVLNHEATPGFLQRQYARYEQLLTDYRDPVGDDRLADFRQAEYYVLRRPEFVREDIRRAFGLAGIYTVQVNVPREYSLAIDGYKKNGAYSGRYFADQTVRMSLPGVDEDATVVWRVNGKTLSGNPARIQVTVDTVIDLVRVDSGV